MTVLLVVVLTGLSSRPAWALEVSGDTTYCHDPSRMVQLGGRYYIFSTAPNVNVRSSADLVEWRWEDRSFSYSSGMPPWMDALDPAGDLWAPDVIQSSGGASAPYLLFYSRNLIANGTEHSVCGVATGPSPKGPWTDGGSVLDVVLSQAYYRVIDPAPAYDAQGGLWLAVGSYGFPSDNGYENGGIRIFQVDPQTGKLRTPGDPGTRIAGSWIEAPFIYQHQGYYYLFFNQGVCCNGSTSTYFVRVGRSTSITGPYVDMEGQPLLNPTSGGSLFMGRDFNANYTGSESVPVPLPNVGTVGREIGPGHAAVVKGSDGIERVSYHFYDEAANGQPTLGIKTVVWGASGWPRTGWDLAEGTMAIGTRLNADPGASTAVWLSVAATGAELTSYRGAATQLWDVHHVDLNRFTLSSHESGLALRATSTGEVQVTEAVSGDPAQIWFIEQTSDMSFRIMNVASGQALAVPTVTAAVGQRVDTAAYDMTLNSQRWFLTPAGVYRVRSLNSRLYLTAGSTPASDIAQGALVDGPRQQFSFVPTPDGYTEIKNVETGLVMAVAGASMADGARVEEQTPTNSDEQRWSADVLTDGSRRLVPKVSGKALQVPTSPLDTNGLVEQHRWYHTRNQQWSLEFLRADDPPANDGADGGLSALDGGGESGGGATSCTSGSGGCGCRVSGPHDAQGSAWIGILALGAFAAVVRRRRTRR